METLPTHILELIIHDPEKVRDALKRLREPGINQVQFTNWKDEIVTIQNLAYKEPMQLKAEITPKEPRWRPLWNKVLSLLKRVEI